MLLHKRSKNETLVSIHYSNNQLYDVCLRKKRGRHNKVQ